MKPKTSNSPFVSEFGGQLKGQGSQNLNYNMPSSKSIFEKGIGLKTTLTNTQYQYNMNSNESLSNNEIYRDKDKTQITDKSN